MPAMAGGRHVARMTVAGGGRRSNMLARIAWCSGRQNFAGCCRPQIHGHSLVIMFAMLLLTHGLAMPLLFLFELLSQLGTGTLDSAGWPACGQHHNGRQWLANPTHALQLRACWIRLCQNFAGCCWQNSGHTAMVRHHVRHAASDFQLGNGSVTLV